MVKTYTVAMWTVQSCGYMLKVYVAFIVRTVRYGLGLLLPAVTLPVHGHTWVALVAMIYACGEWEQCTSILYILKPRRGKYSRVNQSMDSSTSTLKHNFFLFNCYVCSVLCILCTVCV
jgi:hypothetical protein